MITSLDELVGTASGWTNSNNAIAADGVYATSSWQRIPEGGGVFDSEPTEILELDGFGFPINGTIVGIYVEFKGKGSNFAGTWSVILKKGTTPVGEKLSLVTATDTVYSLGGNGDLWSSSWSQSDIPSLNLEISATPNSGSGGIGTCSIDYAFVTVFYERPTAFVFTDVASATASTTTESNTVTIAGLTQPAQTSILGGEWRKNGGTYTSGAGTVSNGDVVQVRTTSSPTPGATVNATLSIATVTDTFSVTTVNSDTTPDAFTFSPVTGISPSTTAASAPITVTGINTATPFSVTGGFAGKNSGPATLVSGTVNNGDTLYLLGTANSAFNGQTDVTLTVGGVSATFSIFTRGADTQPNQFTFTDLSGQTASTLITSNIVTMTGMDPGINAPLTFPTKTGSPGTYECNINGAGFVPATGTLNIQNGQTLQLRTTSSASSGGVVTFVASVNGTADSWTVTAITTDTTPDAFTFVDEPNAAPSTVVTSNEITVSGTDTAANVTFSSSGGSSPQYRKTVAGVWTAWAALASTTIAPGQKLQVRITAPATIGGTASITMTVGGVSDAYNVTVVDADTVPNPFAFVDLTAQAFGTPVVSAPAQITGINSPAVITISGAGQYRVSSDNGATWTPWGITAGTVNNHDLVQVRLTTAATQQTTVSSMITVGGISDSFDATTRSPSPASQYVTTFREVASWH